MSNPRRSSRQSTPTSPPPSYRNAKGGAPSSSASTPSISSLIAPQSASRKTRATSPAPQSARPALPKLFNQLMINHTGKLHKVKIQTLNLNGKDDPATITIARVKCPVPKGVPGHIIKRFDTGAVSASSLFRAAFPLASEAEETTEMAWISKGSRQRYGDTKVAGMEHDETRKLSGTWIPSQFADMLAKEYGITKFASELIAHSEAPTTTLLESAVIPDSENDSPVAARTTKRARVASPPVPSSLSGASTQGLSILQTLSTDPVSGIQTEITQVSVETPAASVANGLIASDAEVAQQIADAKELVQKLKDAGTLAELTESTSIPDSKKRNLDQVEPDDEEATEDDSTPADKRGFFGKIFKRAPKSSKGKERRVPKNAGRVKEEVAGATVALLQKEGVTPEGRRWIAGLGLAVAVGATAAAPYLFG